MRMGHQQARWGLQVERNKAIRAAAGVAHGFTGRTVTGCLSAWSVRAHRWDGHSHSPKAGDQTICLVAPQVAQGPGSSIAALTFDQMPDDGVSRTTSLVVIAPAALKAADAGLPLLEQAAQGSDHLGGFVQRFPHQRQVRNPDLNLRSLRRTCWRRQFARRGVPGRVAAPLPAHRSPSRRGVTMYSKCSLRSGSSHVSRGSPGQNPAASAVSSRCGVSDSAISSMPRPP